MQLLLIRKFYCFRPGPHISFKYAWHNHLCHLWHNHWWEKYFSKRCLIKHTCSWRDKLVLLWTLNRQAKIFLGITSSKPLVQIHELRVPIRSCQIKFMSLKVIKPMVTQDSSLRNKMSSIPEETYSAWLRTLSFLRIMLSLDS